MRRSKWQKLFILLLQDTIWSPAGVRKKFFCPEKCTLHANSFFSQTQQVWASWCISQFSYSLLFSLHIAPSFTYFLPQCLFFCTTFLLHILPHFSPSLQWVVHVSGFRSFENRICPFTPLGVLATYTLLSSFLLPSH